VFECLKENELDVKRMCGVATDGASVMMGRHTGVVTRLKQQAPGLLSSHCIAHRLALASGGAADKVPYLLKYQEFVNAIYLPKTWRASTKLTRCWMTPRSQSASSRYFTPGG
jgi:hypothetical protein